MSQVGVDLFDFREESHLVCVDHWSSFPLYCELRSTMFKAVCTALTAWFNILDWPQHIHSYGGPQFCSEFAGFSSRSSIRHELASPYNPWSNGLAEAGVKICKLLLAKAAETKEEDPHTSFMSGEMPLEPLDFPQHHLQNNSLPQHSSAFKQISFEEASRARDRVDDQSQPSFDRGNRKLPALEAGDYVQIQDPKTGHWS